ncbi:MAG: DMT family transporter [Candidatus Micrarchaeia archaeon]
MLTASDTKAYIMLSIAIIELSFLPIAMDIGGSSLDFANYLFYTFLFGTLVSLVLVVVFKRTKKLKEIAENRRLFAKVALIGIMNYVIAGVFLTIGTVHTSASLGGVVFRLWVLLSVLFIPPILKTRITKYQIASLIIAFLALYIAMTNGSIISINQKELPFVIILVFSALSAAVSNVMMKAVSADLYSEIFLFNLFSLICIAPARFLLGFNTSIGIYAMLAVLFAGGITYSLGSFLYFYALRRLDVTIVGNATLLVPFLTFFFSFELLGEPVHPYYIVLAFLIIIGIIIQQKSPSKLPRYITSKYKTDFPIFDVTSFFANSSNQEILSYLSGSGKALAVPGRLSKALERMPKEEQKLISQKYNCLLFTDACPHYAMGKDENESIRRINKNYTKDRGIVFSIGDPKNSEEVFQFLSKNAGSEEVRPENKGKIAPSTTYQKTKKY